VKWARNIALAAVAGALLDAAENALQFTLMLSGATDSLES